MPSPDELLAEKGVTRRAFLPQDTPRLVPATDPTMKFPLQLAADMEIGSGPQWAIEDLFPMEGLAAIYGGPGSGKTFLALDAGLHVAAGKPWFGKEVEQGGVIYVAAEAGAGIAKRLRACLMQRDLGADFIPFAVTTVAPNLGNAKPGSNDAQTLVDAIRKQLPLLQGYPVRMIVIDTLHRTLYGADENSSADMGAFIANCGLLQQAFGCLVVAVHHSGKNEESGMRGSSALHGACDAEWKIADAGGLRSAEIMKLKEGEEGVSWTFRLGVQQVGEYDAFQTSETGRKLPVKKAITSCYVEPETFPKLSEGVAKRKTPTGADAIMFRAVREALDRFGEERRPSADFPLLKCVKRKDIQKVGREMAIGNPDNEKSQQTYMNGLLNKLRAGGFIVIHGQGEGEFLWLA